MPTTKELRVTVGRTLSDGNYGSLRYEVTEVVSLSPKDDANQVFNTLTKRVKSKASRLKKELIK